MKKLPAILLVFLLALTTATAQQKGLVAGPMTGSIELRDVIIWVEVAPSVKQLAVRYWPQGRQNSARTRTYEGALGKTYNPVKIQLINLDPSTVYEYEIITDKVAAKKSVFKTKSLWQYRTPAPDFTFLTGSCAYFNEEGFDRPGSLTARIPPYFSRWPVRRLISCSGWG